MPSEFRGQTVAFFNWRDQDHPRAGGAEVYCHRLAERFAAAGAEVQIVTSRPKGAARYAERDGVRIHRGGNALGVYLYALWWLLRTGAWTASSTVRTASRSLHR